MSIRQMNSTRTLGLPVPELMRAWEAAEPGRFPLCFGGLLWAGDDDVPHKTVVTSIWRNHHAAALDAAAQNLHSLTIERPAPSFEVPEPPSTVRAVDLIGQTHEITEADHESAVVRCVVAALVHGPRPRAKAASMLIAVSFSGEAVTLEGAPNESLPANDIRTWAKLEPSRFEQGDSEHPRLLMGGSAINVLVPVHRAMVALQYFTIPTVLEGALERGWAFRLRVEQGKGFVCRLTDGTGRQFFGRYPTPGPACVKAYIEGLRGLS